MLKSIHLRMSGNVVMCWCKCHQPTLDWRGQPVVGVAHAIPCCVRCQYCRANVKEGADEHIADCKARHELEQLEKAKALVKATKKPRKR